MNLITNASEALGTARSRPGDRLRVRRPRATTRTRLRTELRRTTPLASGHYVGLAVEDTGCGMDAETHERIFEPFFTTKFAGRGLGMAAVQGIVRGHAGASASTSEPGRGTTVTVVLPAAEGAPRSRSSRSTVPALASPAGTVLLADDEPGVRTLGETMLESAGFEVVTVEDGRRAVEVVREIRNDVVCVILDLTMPVMDGEEAFHALREVRPDVPVILCSGYSEQELRDRFDGDVPAGFLQKPFTWDALRRLLARVLVPSA